MLEEMDGGTKLNIHSICRVCLKHLKDESTYDLFCIPGLVKKFCICTSLSVEPQDGYPKNICGVCHTRLNDLHDFQKQCVDSVQKFQEMVAANTFSVDLIDEMGIVNNDDEDQPNFDPLLDQKLELVENQEDVFKMLEQESMEKQEEKEEEEGKNPFDENTSNSSSSDSEDDDFNAAAADVAAVTSESDEDDDKPLSLRVGTRSTNKRDRSVDEEEGEKDSPPKKIRAKRRTLPVAERPLDRIIECHICQQKFKSNNNYQDHMKCHADKLTHHCTVDTCLKGFTTENALRVHVEHCHPDTLQSIPCPEEGCESRFPRIRQLRYHLKTVHKMDKEVLKQRSFPCTECDKVFRVAIALKKHMYKHNGEELPFPCNICGKRFVINSELKFHLMRHAGIKNFVCPYCGVGKTTRQELNQHMNTHTQEKKYKCDYCEHASTNKQAMSNHMKVVHENIKEFACQYCGKTFGKANACKMHELRHTGDMPYRCSICNKGFIYAKVLTVHLKTHEKWKRTPKPEVPADKKRIRKKKPEDGSEDIVKEKKPPRNKVPKIPRVLKTPRIPAKRKAIDNQLHPPHPSMLCAEPVVVRQNPRHVERVDISQLAGTIINPIPSVQVASWMPQDNSCMTTEFALPQDNSTEALEFPFTCPDCGQGFNFSGNLKTHHRIVHERIRDYACRYCEMRFGKANTLKYHEMRHTGEKPEICQHCDFRCIKPDQLKRHQKVHMRPEKPPKILNRPPRQRSNRPRSPTSPVHPDVILAAREELEEHERKELDAKREAEEKRQAIADAAKEQLIIMQQQQAELESAQN